MDLILIICTCPKKDSDVIARKLIMQHLVACVDIVPGDFHFVGWQTTSPHENEATLLITTSDELVEEVYESILEIHSSEIPIIVNIDIRESYSSYIEWLQESLSSYFDEIN
ncbi:MAG: divalent cation tolerance protein CutA [Hassallia sp. WJT32-NPBG1]|jgi:periplasmic divalent cation tolerance protein|nr:divalent cation tolerance protein CutA [Hassallia sp. WJT32-NPBG1]